MIRIYAAENYDEMSEKARIIVAQVIMKPECVLVARFPPVGTYQRLVERYKAGKISFAGVTTVNLDEYKGLSGSHDQSYRYFMQHNLFDHVDVRPERAHVPNGLAEDAEAECAATTRLSVAWAAPTCSCWAWAVTATSALMSPAASS